MGKGHIELSLYCYPKISICSQSSSTAGAHEFRAVCGPVTTAVLHLYKKEHALKFTFDQQCGLWSLHIAETVISNLKNKNKKQTQKNPQQPNLKKTHTQQNIITVFCISHV